MTSEQQPVIPSGKPQIDQWIGGGYPKGSLTMIASRRGAGKTKWILESAITNAQNGIKSLHIGLENPIESNIDFLVYIYGIEEMKKKSTNNLHLAELEQGSLKRLDALIEENVLLNDVDIVYIDSIKPIAAAFGGDITSSDDYSQALEALSTLAKRHHIPIVVEQTLLQTNDIGEPENLTISDVSKETSLEALSFVISLFREKNFHDKNKRQISVRLLQSPLHNQVMEHKESFEFAGDLTNDEKALY